MKNSIDLFTGKKLSNPSIVIGGNGGTGTNSGANEQLSSSSSASQID